MLRPRAKNVEVQDNYTLLITFNNDEKRLFDVKPYFAYNAYKELENSQLFETVRIAGLSIEWQNGQDICPDDLYYNSKEYDVVETQ